MSTPITDTKLSRHVTNALMRNGLFTVEDVITFHKTNGIKTAKCIGEQAVNEIDVYVLRPNGVDLKPKKSTPEPKPPKVKKVKPQPKYPPKKPMGRSTDALVRFKKYFDELYGQGLEIANWHQNGELEPFDNFYESAIEYSLRKEPNK